MPDELLWCGIGVEVYFIKSSPLSPKKRILGHALKGDLIHSPLSRP